LERAGAAGEKVLGCGEETLAEAVAALRDEDEVPATPPNTPRDFPVNSISREATADNQ
jgi:hypothetical protein